MDGLLKRDATPSRSTWDLKAAGAYIDAHDELLKMLMLLFHLTGGKAGRITELLTIEHRNTPSRLRGVHIHGGKMLSVTRHHKARLTTNNEFQVARFYPEPVTSIAYRYLVYIRPLTYMLLRKCFGRPSESQRCRQIKQIKSEGCICLI